jgi:hypothetical protein
VKLIGKANRCIFSGIDASAVEFSKIVMEAPDLDYYRYPFFPHATILTDLSFTSVTTVNNIICSSIA